MRLHNEFRSLLASAAIALIAGCTSTMGGGGTTGTAPSDGAQVPAVLDDATAGPIADAPSGAVIDAAPVDAAPADGAPSTSTAQLLAYVTSLPAKSQHRILLGQHSDYYPSQVSAPADYIDNINFTPAPIVLGVGIGGQGSQEGTYAAAIANAWIARGGIVELSLWQQQGAVPGLTTAQAQAVPSLDMHYDATTNAPAAWGTYLDAIAATLKQIHGPVLFRPFVELNGSWFWWGNQDPTTFKNLWIQIHAGLAKRGVDNVLWVYNVNAGVGNYATYFPGSAYVDIVSWDSYHPGAGDAAVYNALVALGKPIMLAETSNDTATCAGAGQSPDQLIQLANTSFPKVFAAVFWSQGCSLDRQSGLSTLLADSLLVTLP